MVHIAYTLCCFIVFTVVILSLLPVILQPEELGPAKPSILPVISLGCRNIIIVCLSSRVCSECFDVCFCANVRRCFLVFTRESICQTY